MSAKIRKAVPFGVTIGALIIGLMGSSQLALAKNDKGPGPKADLEDEDLLAKGSKKGKKSKKKAKKKTKK